MASKRDEVGLEVPTIQWAYRHGLAGWNYTGQATDAWGMDRIGSGSGFAVREVARRALFVAPTGEMFETVREMFDRFRLRSCRCDRRVDHLEQMRDVLTLVEAEVHRTDQDLFVANGFGGSRGFMEHYVQWLENERLLDCAGSTIADVSLTTEARAALLMLRQTRPGSNVDCSAAAVLARHRKYMSNRIA